LDEVVAEDAIAIPQQVSRDLVKRKGLSQLRGSPFRSRMRGHVAMGDPAPLVSKHQEDVPDLEANRRPEDGQG
jgi:hypothetical protein